MCVCSVVSDSRTPWGVTHEAPCPLEFSRQEYWSGFPFSTPGDLSDQGLNPNLLRLLHRQADSFFLFFLAGRFFTTEPRFYYTSPLNSGKFFWAGFNFCHISSAVHWNGYINLAIMFFLGKLCSHFSSLKKTLFQHPVQFHCDIKLVLNILSYPFHVFKDCDAIFSVHSNHSPSFAVYWLFPSV